MGRSGGYHDLCSRFILFDELYDELYFCEKKSKKSFELRSNINFPDNIIYVLYEKLCKMGLKEDLEKLFKDKALYLKKNIPHGGGLGGGSSDGAAFLSLIDEKLNLNLSFKEKVEIAKDISSDMPFFLSAFKAANVRGRGELVEKFDDKPCKIELFFPKISCNTAKVFKEFAKMPKYFEDEDYLVNKKTPELLKLSSQFLNDLYAPACRLYPGLKSYYESGYFLSGSGSSVYRRKDENNS